MRTQATPRTPSRRSRGTDAPGSAGDVREQASGAVAVGVDGSRASGAALQWAADQALLTGRPLTVVHAAHRRWSPTADGAGTSPITERQAGGPTALTWARELLERGPALPDVRFGVVHGAPRAVLLDVSEHADLVVVGAPSSGSARTHLLGSVGSALTHHAGCPVVVRRPPADAGDCGVMVGTDGVRDSEAAVEWAYRQAAVRGTRLTLVRTFVDGDSVGNVAADEQGHEALWSQLRFVEQQFSRRHPSVPVSLRLERGFPADALANAALHMDTVVVGTHVRRAHPGFLDENVTTSLVESAPCSVAVVPTMPLV